MSHFAKSVQHSSTLFSSPQRWLVSCDESGVGGETHYGFGALWMKEQRRGDFVREVQRIRDAHKYAYECKWQKANNHRYLEFYKELVDLFFKKEWLAFHCFIIRKALIDKSFHNGDYDLARRKHFTGFLVDKLKGCIKANRGKQNTFRIWVDKIASRYEKSDEAVGIIAERILNLELGSGNRIEAVTTRDSKDTPSIQLCDLLLGATIQAWNRTSESEVKAKVQVHVASYLGWPDLASDTDPSERKFNIWYFHDTRKQQRDIETRKVCAKYPLPKKRMMIVRS